MVNQYLVVTSRVDDPETMDYLLDVGDILSMPMTKFLSRNRGIDGIPGVLCTGLNTAHDISDYVIRREVIK